MEVGGVGPVTRVKLLERDRERERRELPLELPFLLLFRVVGGRD